jgi:hypothetical protein
VNARPAMMPAASTLSRLNGHEANAARSRLMPIAPTTNILGVGLASR